MTWKKHARIFAQRPAKARPFPVDFERERTGNSAACDILLAK
jgi:hypothetical protein